MSDGVMIVDGREYRLVRVAGGSRKPVFDVFVRRVPIGRELNLEAVKTLVRQHAEKLRRAARRNKKRRNPAPRSER